MSAPPAEAALRPGIVRRLAAAVRARAGIVLGVLVVGLLLSHCARTVEVCTACGTTRVRGSVGLGPFDGPHLPLVGTGFRERESWVGAQGPLAGHAHAWTLREAGVDSLLPVEVRCVTTNARSNALCAALNGDPAFRAWFAKWAVAAQASPAEVRDLVAAPVSSVATPGAAPAPRPRWTPEGVLREYAAGR